MINLFITIIKTLFIDPLQRLIGLLTIAQTAGVIWVIQHWEITDKVPLTLIPLLVYISTIALSISFGLFALFIVTSFKKRTPKSKTVRLKDLSVLAVDILKAFGQQEDNYSFTTKVISIAFGTIFQQTQFEIDQLVQYHLLNFDGSKYFLNNKGRAFLSKYKLM